MANKLFGYIVGGIQLIAGILTGNPLLIVSGLTTIAGTALAPRPSGGRGGWEKSNTYGFDNVSNAAFEGSPRFFVLGEHLIGPSYVSVETVMQGQKQFIKALMYCGTGGDHGIESISDIRINDQPIGHYSDIDYEVRYGTQNQTKIEGFDTVSIPHEVGVTFDADTRTYTYETEEAVDEVGLVLVWYGGLYSTKAAGGDAGDAIAHGWGVYVEYSEDDGDTWTPITKTDSANDGWSSSSAGGWFRKDKSLTTYRAVIKLNWSTRKKRLIRMSNANYNVKEKYHCEATLSRVEERFQSDDTHSGDALLAITALADGQLSGGLPRITCVEKGWKVYPATTGSTARWSNNPGDLLMAFLTNKEDSVGDWFATRAYSSTYNSYVSADIDFTSFSGFAVWCDQKIRQGGIQRTRHELNIVVDSMQPATEWLDHVMSICRAQVVEFGGKLHIVYDDARAIGVVFDGRSSPNVGSNVRPILSSGDDTVADVKIQEINNDERMTHVRVQYFDKGNNYERTWTKELVDPDWDSSDPKVIGELYAPGITNQAQALRHGRYMLNRARIQTKVYEWNVGIGDLDLLPFDRITMFADSPAINALAVQIIGSTINEDGTGSYIGVNTSNQVYGDYGDLTENRVKLISRKDALKKAKAIPRGASNLVVRELKD